MENAKIKKFQCEILSNFQTLCEMDIEPQNFQFSRQIFFTDSLYLLRMHLQCTQIGALRVPTLGPLDGHVYGHSVNRLGSFVFLVLDHRCARYQNLGKVCLC